jgi:predicted ATP-dependent endonuclease of OLD family
MRLIKAHVSGYGRLVKCSVNLDAKVIAIVGPNEAGKTTLLEALEYLGSDERMATARRTRSKTVDDNDIVINCEFIVEQEDLEALIGFDLTETPERFSIGRAANGRFYRIGVWPEPQNNPKIIKDALRDLKRLIRANKSQLKKLFMTENEVVDGPQSESIEVALGGLVNELEQQLGETPVLVSEPMVESLNMINEVLIGVDAKLIDSAAEMVRLLSVIAEWAQREDPEPKVWTVLKEQLPDLLFFGDADRNLLSKYTLTQEVLNDPPLALSNVLLLADLSINELWTSISNSDEGHQETLILRANQALMRTFDNAWSQSNISVHLKLSERDLSIMIRENDDFVTVFDERSAGLRAFVAMHAFVSKAGSAKPPVLLIDEAETHLHWDAQRDLITMFSNQDRVAKVIYTTHSPACLPQDLGTGIRCVVPTRAC